MVGIVDYGMGNILSVKNALEMAGAKTKICVHPEDISEAERIVIPGVGSFGDCIDNLRSKGFIEALEDFRLGKARPILGICLGMQVMAKKGYESGEHQGLGWFDAEVRRLEPSDKNLRIPHIGWNNISLCKKSALLKGLPESPDLYFVHSFYMDCRKKEDVLAVFEYGGSFTAAVEKDNVIATQFHPEKSQDYGVAILNNFLTWNPA